MANVVRMVVNRRAQQRYATFWNALVQVDSVLWDARKLASVMEESGSSSPWWVASPAEVRKAVSRVEAALATLCKSGKKWEAELISREWRK